MIEFDELGHLQHKLHERTTGFLHEFHSFVFKQNIISMAIGIIIGGATSQVANALINDAFMPVVNVFVRNQSWKTWSIPLSPAKTPDGKFVHEILIGDLMWQFFYLVIVGIVAFFLARLLIKKPSAVAAPPPPPPMRQCPFCLENVLLGAKKCKFCTSDLPPLPQSTPAPAL